MKQEKTDGESAKAAREQEFLLGYESESGIVESSVSRSSAHSQYCHFCPWSMAENKKSTNLYKDCNF